jgi:hypothetical protein
MKIVTLILSVVILNIGVMGASAQLHKDESGRWVNSKGGNIYGDSRYNIDADPTYNIDGDPRY